MKIWRLVVTPALLALSACGSNVVIENFGAEVGPSSATSGPSGSGGASATGAGGANVGGASATTTGATTTSGAGGCGPGTVDMGGQCVPADSAAPCLVGGNVLYLNGEPGDLVHPGVETLQQGQWSAEASSTHVGISYNGLSPGVFWTLDFSSEQLPGSPPLTAQIYPNATRWPFEAPGEPGESINGNGVGCNTYTGQFQIKEITFEAGTLKTFTASFQESCDNLGPLLRGCVHFEQ